MADKPVLGFIGVGKVGATLARLWFAAGYRVAVVQSRDALKAGELAKRIEAEAVLTYQAVVKAADLVLLTVPDDAIEDVARKLAGANWRGKAVIHTSGARDRSGLEILHQQGAMTGSLHPVFPFADVESAITGLPGHVFAAEVEGEPLRSWLNDLVKSLQGDMLMIPSGEKAIYHSAMVFASNYVVTLYSIAERLLGELGADPVIAQRALSGLLAGTVANIQQKGIPEALTGPLVRQDAGTIGAHLAALEEQGLENLYRELAQQSLPMLKARQIDTRLVETLLRRDEDDAYKRS